MVVKGRQLMNRVKTSKTIINIKKAQTIVKEITFDVADAKLIKKDSKYILAITTT